MADSMSKTDNPLEHARTMLDKAILSAQAAHVSLTRIPKPERAGWARLSIRGAMRLLALANRRAGKLEAK